jgi:hypothetical protein
MVIQGPERFCLAVTRLAGELRDKAPQRYSELVRHMPRLRYDPEALREEHPEGALGRADGVLALDGSDYEFLMRVLLHELGHNVASHEGLGDGERWADRYAAKVLSEMRRCGPLATG